MKQAESTPDILTPIETFTKGLGISRTTIWRWRKRGWVKTVQIANRHYILKSERERFHQRACEGQFASELAPRANNEI